MAIRLRASKPRKPLCSKVCHATKEEAERAAEIMFKRWNEKKRRSGGNGDVIANPHQIDKPQVFYPKYCYLCRTWHVTSASVTPRNNKLHSKHVREFRPLRPTN